MECDWPDSIHDEPTGPLTAPYDPMAPLFRIRELDAYCKARNIKPSELTGEEVSMFEVPRNDSQDDA